MANAANQALLQALSDFRSLTQNLINDFREDHAPTEEPVVDQIQQAHTATAQKDLILIIKELRDEVQLLKTIPMLLAKSSNAITLTIIGNTAGPMKQIRLIVVATATNLWLDTNKIQRSKIGKAAQYENVHSNL